jgi:hypothetical protein
MSPPIEKSDARRRRERGAALVEFAFVLIPLLILLLGIIDFGRAYGAKQTLIHATREGVRVYVVTQDHDDAYAAFRAGATSLDLDLVSVTIPPDSSCSPGEPVEVSASYDFDFFLDRLLGFLPGEDPLGPIKIGSEAVMRCGG